MFENLTKEELQALYRKLDHSAHRLSIHSRSHRYQNARIENTRKEMCGLRKDVSTESYRRTMADIEADLLRHTHY